MREVNAALTPTAAVKDNILSVEHHPREPTTTPLVVNAGLAMPEPYSATGDSSCRSTTTADMGSSSLDLELESFCGPRNSLIRWGKEVNRSLGEQDQTAPVAARSYVTTAHMVAYEKTRLGYWKEKEVKAVRNDELVDGGPILSLLSYEGIRKTFQFHDYDGNKTNWFIHEYIPTNCWGSDLFMGPLRFRVVGFDYKGAEVPGEPTSPEVKIKNKIAAAKKHRMRGPNDPKVVKGESPAWQHFIKIYDRHPELDGSKVVYAVCCYCEGVLKAGSGNGTNSLSTHCNRTCPRKHLQPSSS